MLVVLLPFFVNIVGYLLHRLVEPLTDFHLDDAMKLFKEISQLGRPSLVDRRATANLLKAKLNEPHYLSAGDALGMVDLTPDALGVPADPVRLFLQTKVPPILHPHGNNHQPAPQPTIGM
jgi:hypothetical protein